MKKYKQFRHIKLSDTLLFYGSPTKDAVYKRLVDNGIYTLEDLFIKYDNNSIDYGNVGKSINQYKLHTEGVIKLLRYKYLNIPLKINPFMELNDYSDSETEMAKLIQSCGLTSLASKKAFYFVKYNNDDKKIVTLYDVFNYFKYNDIYSGNSFIDETFKEKIRLLLKNCEDILKGLSYEEYMKVRKNFADTNPWFELYDKRVIDLYHYEKQWEVIDVFDFVNWDLYNDVQNLDNEKEVKIYAYLKNKARKNLH